MKINLNNVIKVKLSPHGKKIYIEHINQLKNQTPIYSDYYNAEIKTLLSQNYTEFQLWAFMRIFGSYMIMGSENIVENNEIEFT